MSDSLPVKPRHQSTLKANIAIVCAKYNPTYTDALLQHVKTELADILPTVELNTARVPGAFEIPVICETLLNSKNTSLRPQLIICLGVIIQGQTKHAELVATSVTNSIQSIAVNHCTPIINEVLLVESEAQAQERCLGLQLNRGKEAARAAYSILKLVEAITKA